MFDIAWSEFLVVAVVALVVVGPKDLPPLLRTIGKTVANLRRMAGEFQTQFNEAMREAELDDLKKEVTGLKDAASKLAGPNPFQIARNELKSALENKPPAAPSALAGEAPKPDPGIEAPSALAPAPAVDPVDEPPAAELAAKPKLKPKRKKANGAAHAATEPDADEAPAPPPPGAAA